VPKGIQRITYNGVVLRHVADSAELHPILLECCHIMFLGHVDLFAALFGHMRKKDKVLIEHLNQDRMHGLNTIFGQKHNQGPGLDLAHGILVPLIKQLAMVDEDATNNSNGSSNVVLPCQPARPDRKLDDHTFARGVQWYLCFGGRSGAEIGKPTLEVHFGRMIEPIDVWDGRETLCDEC